MGGRAAVFRLGRRRHLFKATVSQPRAKARPNHSPTPRHGGRASECDGDGVLAGGCGGSGGGGGGAAEASRVVEGLPPHTGLQLRASFLFVDAWRGERLLTAP